MKDFKKESFLSTEQIIIGFLLGVFMTFWAGKALIEGVSLTGSHLHSCKDGKSYIYQTTNERNY